MSSQWQYKKRLIRQCGKGESGHYRFHKVVRDCRYIETTVEEAKLRWGTVTLEQEPNPYGDGWRWIVLAGWVDHQRVLPHPLSKNSFKRIMRKYGRDLQMIEAGAENNATYTRSGIRVHREYMEALERVRLFVDKEMEKERST